MDSLILAVRFLTIVPVPGREDTGPGALGRAAWWFPVIGLALGACLAGADRALRAAFPPFLAAALLVVAWKIVTGGIHLDGLVDTLDGLAGRDPERRIAIMRGAGIGAFGAAGLVLCLVLAVGAVDALPPARRPALLLLAPAIGRLAPLLIGPLFPPATPGEGLGASFLEGLSPWAIPVHVAILWGLAAILLGPWAGLLLSLALGVVLLWAVFLAARLGGLTGDGLGSSVELGEVAVLIAAAGLGRLNLF